MNKLQLNYIDPLTFAILRRIRAKRDELRMGTGAHLVVVLPSSIEVNEDQIRAVKVELRRSEFCNEELCKIIEPNTQPHKWGERAQTQTNSSYESLFERELEQMRREMDYQMFNAFYRNSF